MEAPEIRNQALQQLDETFLKMTSPEWDLALLGKPPNVKAEAAEARERVQLARLRLGNAVLGEIRDKLVENEEDLAEGRRELSNVLEKFEKIEAALGAISSFLSIVGRIVSLI
jgi:chromosome segregation ATPase